MSKDTKADIYKPTGKRKKILEVMLNPKNRFLSITDICKAAPCTRSMYYRAFEDERFVAYYKAKAKDLISRAVMPVVNAFVKEAKCGSFQHGKAILEMTEIYVNKMELTGKGGEPMKIKHEFDTIEEVEAEMKRRGIPIEDL